jgi:N-methylhydantoinase B
VSTVIEPKADDARQADPITYEVIRHRLLGITTEQAARLVTISGSKHVTEMSDYNVGLYLPDGSVAAMGRTILFHSACMAAMVRSVVADCEENPGIGPGDMFIVNDPWKGSVHAPDMAIVAPLFIDGELVLWAGAMMHMSDIGGMSEGSMVVQASEAYAEGMLLPPMKLVENGKIRNDIWQMILGNCRHASTMSLDLKGLMAANMAAMEGLEKLVRRYGSETLHRVMAGLIRGSENRLRKRLSELPDATIVASGFMEYDESLGGIPEVHLELTKRGDTLYFDFSKSSPQVRNSTNCTRGGLLAGISAALLPTLAYDIPWNEGLYHAIEVTCPEGLICNARKPAAVSGNISGAVWEVEIAATVALSRLVSCSDAFLHESQASPCGRPGSLAFFGTNQHGERFMGRTYDVLASGAAAYAHRDGVSTQGHHNIERTLISNVEALELDLPMLYLRRGLAPDSGGAGRHRGGLSVLGVYKPHKLASTFLRIGAQWKVPDAVGAYGGSPGSRTGSELMRNTDVLAQFAAGHVPEFDDLAGEAVVPGSVPQQSMLEPNDVVRANPPAGAGWGDPLDRLPEAIQADLDAGAISRSSAIGVYACTLDAAGHIDLAGTQANRERLRGERKSWPRNKNSAAPAGTLTRLGPMGDSLEIARGGSATWTRCTCGFVFGPAADSWREYAARRAVKPDPAVAGSAMSEAMELREYACPGCGRLHAVDICRKTDPDPHDIRLAL